MAGKRRTYAMTTRLGWKTALLVLGMASLLCAAEVSQTEYAAPQGEPPRREVTTQATVQATVQKIDYKKRKVTLKEESGDVTEMQVGPEVQRFDEIKKGDILLVDYLESIALYVHKAEKGQKPSHDTDVDAARAWKAKSRGFKRPRRNASPRKSSKWMSRIESSN